MLTELQRKGKKPKPQVAVVLENLKAQIPQQSKESQDHRDAARV